MRNPIDDIEAVRQHILSQTAPRPPAQAYFPGWLLIAAAPEWAAERGIKPGQLCMISEDRFGELLEAAAANIRAKGGDPSDVFRFAACAEEEAP
jgi:hypothetical protein